MAGAATFSSLRHSLTATLLLLLLLTASPLASSGHYYLQQHASASTISVAPSLLPGVPDFPSAPPSASTPSLAPAVMPTFPSPGDDAGVPPPGSLPTIPSSPSPPNPDDLEQDSAVAPAGAAPMDTGAAGHCESSGGAAMACVVLLMWLLELVGKRRVTALQG